MEWIKEIISTNSASILTICITLILTIFGKMILSIYKAGLMHSKELMSREEHMKEMNNFKAEVRADMRAYKTELTEVMMQTSVKIINEKLKDMDQIKAVAIDMKAVEARMNEQVKTIDEKYAEFRSVSDNMRSMNARIESLSSNMGNQNTQTRRKDG